MAKSKRDNVPDIDKLKKFSDEIELEEGQVVGKPVMGNNPRRLIFPILNSLKKIVKKVTKRY